MIYLFSLLRLLPRNKKNNSNFGFDVVVCGQWKRKTEMAIKIIETNCSQNAKISLLS